MANDKKALLDFAEKSIGNYPKSLIWFQFSFMGGLIGGFLTGLGFAYNSYEFSTKANFLVLCSFIGVFVGFIPASLTGWLLAKKEFVILNKSDYGKVFFIGGIFGGVYGLVLSLLFKGFDLAILGFYGLFFMVLSGVSAMICGKLFLPKAIS